MKNFFLKFGLFMLFAAVISGTVHGEPAPQKSLPVQVASNTDSSTTAPDPYLEPESVWDEMDRMHQQLNQMFRSSFTRNPIQIGQTSGVGMPAGRAIASSVDVAETADQIVVSCDVPGVDKEDIKIDIKNNVLTIRGERKNKIERSKSSDQYQYHHQEIQFGGFERSFVLPDQVDPGSAVAEHKNGVLTVRINKIEGKEPIRVPIQ